ncbi:MAG: hypothetical protein KAW12_12165 [Candidatus Aminicenantes bacterium]|nr:hypothetical protein [Candidatus Aminicenantes bacterium]
MKKIVIISVLVLFFLGGLAYGQDCGKCPAKLKCAKAKIQEGKNVKDNPVFITEKDKIFHKKDCKLIKGTEVSPIEAKEVTPVEAKKKGYEPCQECFPPVKQLTKPQSK